MSRDDSVQLVRDLGGVALPGALHPRLVAPLRPAASGHLVQHVVIAVHLLLVGVTEHSDDLDVRAGAVHPCQHVAGGAGETADGGQQIRRRPVGGLVAHRRVGQYQVQQYPFGARDDQLAK